MIERHKVDAIGRPADTVRLVCALPDSQPRATGDIEFIG